MSALDLEEILSDGMALPVTGAIICRYSNVRLGLARFSIPPLVGANLVPWGPCSVRGTPLRTTACVISPSMLQVTRNDQSTCSRTPSLVSRVLSETGRPPGCG